MKEHPIIFSTDMVRAILDGRKVMTRRILKRQPDNRGVRTTNVQFEDWHGVELKCPQGKVGDLLWVRESAYLHKQEKRWYYKATDILTDSITYGYRWKPSIHMKRVAARLFLEVTDIRVERLNDISEEDAIAEGVEQEFDTYLDYGFKDKTGSFTCVTAKESFQTLWESIHGKDSWNANPWVWVIKFNRIENF